MAGETEAAAAERRPYLELWTVFDSPADHPRGPRYIARRSVVDQAGTRPCGEVVGCHELGPLRAWLAGLGLVQMDRHPDDDRHLVEVWF
jgi:hypothetical protein